MADPTSGIIGDNTGVDLPQMQIDDRSLVEEKKMAKYSKTAEFARLREHCEAKIAYYQQFLPGNIPPEAVPEEERGKYWAIANIVIKEFNELIGQYELAAQVVKDVQSAQQ